MATIRTESLSPFSIYEDRDVFDGTPEPALESQDVSFTESCDVPIASIENTAPQTLPEEGATPSKRRISGMTSTSISSFPSELSMGVKGDGYTERKFTPMRNRPAFRNPSSVKAMQMGSPQSYSPVTTPQSQKAHRFITPSRRSATPQSRRSQSILSNHMQVEIPSDRNTPMREPERQRCPLVLLHVNLLPLSLQYPAHILESTLPSWLLQNFCILEEKLEDPLIMGRGVLIPHPRHEYDLLEERVLESLELASPRLLQCGHYNGRQDEDDVLEVGWDERDEEDTATESGSQTTEGPPRTEDDLCHECEQPYRHPDRGVGYGKRKWEVRIYAANGLMRAGAWSAAWSEMERVDVEVVPWIPEDLKRRLQEEVKRCALAVEMAHGVVTPPVSVPPLSRRETVVETPLTPPPLRAESQAPVYAAVAQESPFDGARLSSPFEDVRYGGGIRYESFNPDAPVDDSLRNARYESAEPEPSNKYGIPHGSHYTPPAKPQVPLATLLRNYIYLLAQDRRNIVMAGLSMLVVFLCLRTVPVVSTPQLGLAIEDFQAVPSISELMVTETFTSVHQVTSVATQTQTQTSTTTVVQTETETATVTEYVRQLLPEPPEAMSTASEAMSVVSSAVSSVVFAESSAATESGIAREVESTSAITPTLLRLATAAPSTQPPILACSDTSPADSSRCSVHPPCL